MKKTKGKEEMTFDEWLTYGITRHWSSAPICSIHDGKPDLSKYEQDGECSHYMLVYKDMEMFEDMMENFPPAYWRAHTRGLSWSD